jgi:hypothetical protein
MLEIGIHVGANEIKWANIVTLEKDHFAQKYFFHTNEYLNIFFAICYNKCL